MEFELQEGVAILRRTPEVLRALLTGLPDAWVRAAEGPGAWSAFDVLGHLIHGERTDWVPRVEHLLRHGDAVPFPPFDREAMFAASAGLSPAKLLETFAALRAAGLDRLAALGLGDDDLRRRGRHPEFGPVTLGQHLATWVAHDLSHLGQIARILGRQYAAAVGPWRAYLPLLGPPVDSRAAGG